MHGPAQLLIALVLLGGCTVDTTLQPGPQMPPPQIPPETGASCGAADLQSLIGQPESVLATMRFGTVVRVIHPGDMVTEDYSPSRLNIRIDASGRIAALGCG